MLVSTPYNQHFFNLPIISKTNTKVSKLSGGQKQRVAIARALAYDTPIIVADEPTGSLDRAQSKSILELLHKISKDKLVIIVTHNKNLLSYSVN